MWNLGAFLVVVVVVAVRGNNITTNANNVFGRAKLKQDNGSVRYLGDKKGVEDCLQACQSYDESGERCHSFTYHTKSFGPPWALGCYGDTDWQWNPTKQTGVDCGKVGSWPPPGHCVGDYWCNYNGQCVNGTCHCDRAWKGANCDVLNLIPTKRGLGYHGKVDGKKVTSWGGSVLRGNDGQYHMYAAEITNHCGMNVWLSNSQVIHATSPDPLTTPFTRKSVVSSVFSHEPIAARAPTGEYVVYFTGVLPPTPPPVNGGTPCDGCNDGNSNPSCGTDSNRNWTDALPTYMVYSQNPDGPWSNPVIIPTPTPKIDSNLAPVINKDGSLVGLMRGNVMMATNWKDPSTYNFTQYTWSDAGEDPFVWKDKNGVYHNIVHVSRVNTHGLHYFSKDGTSWTPTPGTGYAYTNHMDHPDGTVTTYACRERPHIIQDEALNIVALTNGAAEVACHNTQKPDYSYTSLQIVSEK